MNDIRDITVQKLGELMMANTELATQNRKLIATLQAKAKETDALRAEIAELKVAAKKPENVADRPASVENLPATETIQLPFRRRAEPNDQAKQTLGTRLAQ